MPEPIDIGEPSFSGEARRVRPGQRGRKVVVKFPSFKMQRIVHAESPLEADFFRLLEIDPSVIRYQPQPLRMRYTIGSRRKSYVPDVLIEYIDGTKTVVEVKHDSWVDSEKFREHALAAREVCLRQGCSFRIGLSSWIRREPRLGNIKLLWQYRFVPFGLEERLRCSRLFSSFGKQVLKYSHLVDAGRSRALSPEVFCAMVYHGALATNIDLPFAENALIRLVDPIRGN